MDSAKPNGGSSFLAATALATILCLTSSVAASAQDAKSKLPALKTGVGPMTLTPSATWAPVGIEARAGDTIVVEARAMGRQVGPAGFPQEGAKGALMPDAPAYALIGRVGAGAPFLLGSGRKLVSPASGTLQLARNIPPGASPERASALSVRADVVHAPAQPPAASSSPPPEVVPTPSVPSPTPAPKPPPHKKRRKVPHPYPTPLPAPVPPSPSSPDMQPVWIVGGLAAAIGIGALGLWGLRRRPEPPPGPDLVISFEASLKSSSSAGSGLGEWARAVPAAELRARLEAGRTSWPGGVPEGKRETDDA